MNIALNSLTNLGLMILAGVLMGRLMKQLSLPNVSGYLIAGILLGPYLIPLLGSPFTILSEGFVSGISVITEVALGLIAFSAGGQLSLSDLKRVGAAPLVITILEAVCADLFVSAGLILAGADPKTALLLGAIASATAPAATILVVRQYHADGPVTRLLLSVVALDDVAALILFSLTSAAVKGFGSRRKNPLLMVLTPAGQILAAILTGLAAGIILLFLLRFFRRRSNRTALICGALFLVIGICDLLGNSPLIGCMMLGAVVTNLSSEADRILEAVDPVSAPVFILFFVASGAGLQFSLLKTVGLLGVLYILLRFAGKMCGTLLGARMCRVRKKTGRYLGPCLLPQAGIAIGLTQAAGSLVPEYASRIRAVVLAGTLICELIGPAVTRSSLKAAGEIRRKTA